MVKHGSGQGESAYGAGMECTSGGEGGDDAVVAAVAADGARRRASRSVHEMGRPQGASKVQALTSGSTALLSRWPQERRR
jgi:hypothetical protein